MNAEVQKYSTKCERYRQKIAEFQALLEEAERKKTQAENAFIVSKVRSSGYTADELIEAVLLLKAQKDGCADSQSSTENFIKNNPIPVANQPQGQDAPAHGVVAVEGSNDKEGDSVES